jgi:uncharacterized protein (DUF305 family)
MIRIFATHACAVAIGVAFAMLCASLTSEVKSQWLSAPRPALASPFDDALRAAMIQMDAGMCITPSGDADRDFARAMIPHHEGAIAMARLELLHGRDANLRRLAQGIVVEQSQEIALLRRLLVSSGSRSDAAFNP